MPITKKTTKTSPSSSSASATTNGSGSSRAAAAFPAPNVTNGVVSASNGLASAGSGRNARPGSGLSLSVLGKLICFFRVICYDNKVLTLSRAIDYNGIMSMGMIATIDDVITVTIRFSAYIDKFAVTQGFRQNKPFTCKYRNSYFSVNDRILPKK